MNQYASYVRSLEHMLRTITAPAEGQEVMDQIPPVLDGQPSEQLRRLVGLNERKKDGAFFTSSDLRLRLIEALKPARKDSIGLDLSCGGGDLLIAFSETLPVFADLLTTLKHWGERLYGCDIHQNFVTVTKIRLIFAAIARISEFRIGDSLNPESLFPNIKVGDGLAEADLLTRATDVLLNPSYSMMPTPNDCKWSSGEVSTAAVFVDHVIRNATPNTSVSAILPDVLRSGSRYTKWRSFVCREAEVRNVQILGQFDAWTDVDVFLLHMVTGSQTHNSFSVWQTKSEQPEKLSPIISDLCEVRVGPVVPHRDKQEGPPLPFINARRLQGKAIYDANEAEYLHSDRTSYMPPFVVIRRTSHPAQGERVNPTLITGSKHVAVENHLLILKPRDGLLVTCHRIVSSLKDDRSVQWLNQRIRCRHYTVSAIRELPIWDQTIEN